MNVLVLDWGNTRIKAGWFVENHVTQTYSYPSLDALMAAGWPGRADWIVVASTSQSESVLNTHFSEQQGRLLVVTSTLEWPISNAYHTPKTLGVDRLAAALGAVLHYPHGHRLVLDAGTCLTADWVDDTDTFRGGLISPGLHMRLQAMHRFTARLPLIALPNAHEWPLPAGLDTRQAMLSGAMNGYCWEVQGLIDTYRQQHPLLSVLLTGGDAPLLATRLKGPIFVEPNAVLLGLYRLFQYHVSSQNADYTTAGQ